MNLFKGLFILALPLSVFAADAELNGESRIMNLQQRMEQVPNTIVVRIKAEGLKAEDLKNISTAEVLFTGEKLSADAASIQQIKDAQFQPTAVKDYSEKDELNRDSSQSAWYFGLYYNPYSYWGWGGFNYYTPSFWYGASAYTYSPYYWGSWGGYLYGYYRRWW